MVEDIVSKYKSDGVWTSGRLCNFHGCDVSKQSLENRHRSFRFRPRTCNPRTSMVGSGPDQVSPRTLCLQPPSSNLTRHCRSQNFTDQCDGPRMEGEPMVKNHSLKSLKTCSLFTPQVSHGLPLPVRVSRCASA